MKATDLLRSQHHEAAALLKRLVGPVGAREAEGVVRELATVLGAHMAIEQELFYPECALQMGDRQMVRGSYVEHAELAAQLRTLLAMSGDDPGFGAQVAAVRALIEGHVADEENSLFVRAEPILGDKRLEVLGGFMEARFDEAVGQGWEVTTAENAIDVGDVDRILARYTPTGSREVPIAPDARETRKQVAAPVRRAAAKVGTISSAKSNEGGRSKPKSGAEGARKSREGR